MDHAAVWTSSAISEWTLDSVRKLIVRERQASIHAAVAFAMERAERAVQRQLQLARAETRTDIGPTAEFGD